MTKVAVIQMNSSSDVESNLLLASKLLTQAAQAGAKLAVLPENFAQMPISEKQRLAVAEDFDNGPIQEFLSNVSLSHNLCIIAGSISLFNASKKKVHSSCLYFNENGTCLSRYDKQHLFDVELDNGEAYRESSYIESGERIRLLNTIIGRIGFSICYDLRFPEFFRLLTEQGAQVITVPSAFTYTTGKAHWYTLLRARAIENQIYILAPGQTGTHDNGRSTYGHSLIFDPWGEQLGIIEQGNGIIYADIDLERLIKVRSQMPCLNHRRYFTL